MAHKITALTPQQHNHQRVNVYLDGEFAFGLARIVAAWLQVGQTLSDDKIAQLQAQDSQEKAYQYALKLLSYRPRSLAEIRQKLLKHGSSEAVTEQVIEQMKNQGLLDDVQFARLWIDNRQGLRPRGRRALAYELKKHGIEDELITAALEEVDEAQLAEQAARKYLHRITVATWPEFREKLSRHLLQRGFPYSTITETVALLWKEQQDQNLLRE